MTRPDSRPEPAGGRFHGLPLDAVDVHGVRHHPQLHAMLQRLDGEGHGPGDRWVRVGVEGAVDADDWNRGERRFAAFVDQDEYAAVLRRLAGDAEAQARRRG